MTVGDAVFAEPTTCGARLTACWSFITWSRLRARADTPQTTSCCFAARTTPCSQSATTAARSCRLESRVRATRHPWLSRDPCSGKAPMLHVQPARPTALHRPRRSRDWPLISIENRFSDRRTQESNSHSQRPMIFRRCAADGCVTSELELLAWSGNGSIVILSQRARPHPADQPQRTDTTIPGSGRSPGSFVAPQGAAKLLLCHRRQPSA